MQKMFDKGQSRYVNNIVTWDDKWLCQYDVPTKSQNKSKDIHAVIRQSWTIKKKVIAFCLNQVELCSKYYIEHRKYSKLRGTLNDNRLKSSKFLRTYDQIQTLILASFIMTMHHLTKQRPASIIWALKDWNYLYSGPCSLWYY